MKLIVVPSDLSEISDNAIEYAVALNRNIKAGIVLLHTYYIPVATSEAAVVLPEKEIRINAVKAIENVREKYELAYPDIVFTTNVSEGFPDIEIISAEKRLHADLVVMGSNESSKLARFFSGSNMAAVLEKSVCPVLCVPGNVKFRHMNRIIFAANYGVDDFKNVFDLIEFAGLFNSEIILLHVSDGKNEIAFDYNQLDSFKNQIQNESGYQNISIKLLEEENVFDGINNYLNEVNADLFAISMRNRSFLKSVFSPGLTRKMVYHSHVPILIYHTNVE
jgi:nucleotide-binding universal stress UspA family protein